MGVTGIAYAAFVKVLIACSKNFTASGAGETLRYEVSGHYVEQLGLV